MAFSFDPAALTVELFLMPRCNLIQIASVIEPLRVANRVLGREVYRWRLVSQDGDPVTTTGGLPVAVAGAFQPDGDAAPLFVIASYQPLDGLAPATLRLLSQARRYRPLIAGVENGSWVMAAAGLLDDRQIAAHWEDADALQARFAGIEVVSQSYVIDGARATTAGSLPTLDMILELIRQRQGFAVAMAVSRQFIYTPSALSDTNGAAPGLAASSLARPLARDPRLSRVLERMDDTLGTPVPVTRLASEIGVSPRQLHKLFVSRFGVSPKQYYLALRLNAARRQLIETGLPVMEIADMVGFPSHASFSLAYRSAYGETPTETRRSGGGGLIAYAG